MFFFVRYNVHIFCFFFCNKLIVFKKKKESGKNCKKKGSSRNTRTYIFRQESQEKQESVKKTRPQESCLARHFLLCQTRFCLQEYHKKVQICFFRQESCIEGMEEESRLITKKIKNLERSVARSSTSAASWKFVSYLVHQEYVPLNW